MTMLSRISAPQAIARRIGLTCKISLNTRAHRVTFAAAALALAFGFAAESARVSLSEIWGASENPAEWKRAVTLDPGNATAWYRLGNSSLDDSFAGPTQAISDLEEAARANSHSEDIWMALAEARENAGDFRRAREAFENAHWTDPISPAVAWRYSNFLLRRDDLKGALTRFRQALEQDTGLSSNVVAECRAAGISPSQVFGQALPPEVDLYFAAIGYYISQRDFSSAIEGWNHVLRLAQAFPLRRALPLIDNLIFQGQADDAARVWNQALTATNWPRDSNPGGSLVFNGGFEHDLAGGGFEWEISNLPGVTFGLDPSQFRSGKRSLRVSFDGSANLDLSNPQQFVYVEPNRLYHFFAWVRTEEISTDRGVGFEIGDRDTGVRVLTPLLTATHSWTNVTASICSGPRTRLLLIGLRRIPSRKFDNKLRGTAWVDDVSLLAGSACGAPEKIP